ncbi:3'-5' exoribonuclease YhaM family protein [Brevibacillus sp. GCM10020057]|uniref:3'-5' exoribonuclease YhaM family protein n=1 Tax=Brevibacillus sp. GCM10020057 TaxID=3317327 RepID=UPI00363DAA71
MRYLTEYQEGERVVAFCLVKAKEAGIASNQSEYLNLELGDRSGTIMAKLWDVSPEMKEAIAVKSVVKIDAIVQNYRGKKQLVIQRIRPATAADEVQMESLVPVSPVPVNELWEKLSAKVQSLQSKTLRSIVEEALADEVISTRLRHYPAGVRMHHNYYHGLLEHIVSLLTAAERLLPLYPQVDRDVLYATCIMHDIGKLYELSDPIAPDYTTPGQLIGHLVMGAEIVSGICRKLDIPLGDAEVLHLKHCILSHHGEVENGWGSAVSGKTPTAVLFHYLDQIDSKMNALGQTLADAGEEEWAYAGVLRRKVWRGY